MMRPSRLLALAVAVLAVSTALPAWAQTDPSEVSGNEMADGPWTGSFTAAGVETRSEGTVTATVTIEDSGTFSFTVAGGATSGTWSSTGTNVWHTDPGQPARLTGTSNLTSSGSLAGGRTNLTGTGTTSQSGTLVIESSGQVITRPISSNTSLTFSMTVTGASCEAAHGVLSGSFISGTFTAINGASFDGDQTQAESGARIEGMVEFLDRYSSYRDRMAWHDELRDAPEEFPRGEFMDLLAEAEAVLNELRNASNCLTMQVGSDVLERWDTAITRSVAEMITDAARYPLSSAMVRSLASAGLRTGAIGSGARNQAQAAATEEDLRSRVETIVNEHVEVTDECPTGCLRSSSELTTAMAVMGQMRWSVDVETGNGAFGGTYSAVSLSYAIDEPLPVRGLGLDG
jgi:hypothetical protein